MNDSVTRTGQIFADMAAAHIDLANGHGKNADQELVSIPLLHSAARYTAFIAAIHSPDKAGMQAARTENLDSISALPRFS